MLGTLRLSQFCSVFLILLVFMFSSFELHAESWREYRAKAQFCADQLEKMRGQLEYAELKKLAAIVDRVFNDGPDSLTEGQIGFIQELQKRPGFPNDLLDKVLKTAEAESLMFTQPTEELAIQVHTGFGSLPATPQAEAQAQPPQPVRHAWRPLRIWLYLIIGLQVYGHQLRQATPEFNEAVSALRLDHTLDSLRDEKIALVRQPNFDSQLAEIFDSGVFPHEIRLNRNMVDGGDVVVLRKINEGGTDARRAATYSFKIGGNPLRYPLEIIEIERFENYRGQGRLLTIQIGAILSDEPSALWLYTREKGLRFAPLSDQ